MNSSPDRNEMERMCEMMDIKMTMFASQIRKLAELRDEELITEEEFAAKKTELLERL